MSSFSILILGANSLIKLTYIYINIQYEKVQQKIKKIRLLIFSLNHIMIWGVSLYISVNLWSTYWSNGEDWLQPWIGASEVHLDWNKANNPTGVNL